MPNDFNCERRRIAGIHRDWNRARGQEAARESLAVGQFFAREINEMLNKQNVTLFAK